MHKAWEVGFLMIRADMETLISQAEIREMQTLMVHYFVETLDSL